MLLLVLFAPFDDQLICLEIDDPDWRRESFEVNFVETDDAIDIDAEDQSFQLKACNVPHYVANFEVEGSVEHVGS